ncbi:hypothetical protein NIES4071_60230 [Calothrix sp. NIES-4071]|nr:hypothetical protein NIES4071_60230 [Calothrix sp. NIES-4071]BAZ60330.1 hypothetical protein NIES4105_60180 [Calothrix sp. NIES-4105]
MSDFEQNLEELVKKIDYLVNKVHIIERRLVKVEKLLDIHNPSFQDEGEEVAGAVEVPSFPKLSLSASEIVEQYHTNCQWLVNKVIKVSLLSESLLQKTDKSFCFNLDKKGNFWIIATTDDKYYLLPKDNFRINAFNYDTIKKIFRCDGYKADFDNQFVIIEPAKVSLAPSGKQWTFTQPGILNFHSTTAEEPEHSKVDTNLEQVQSNQTDNNEIEQLDKLFTSSYNKKPSFLTEHAITVSETLDSKKQRGLGISQSAIFQSDTSGKYWIISTKSSVIYLVPQWDIKISHEDVITMLGIFEFHNYKPEYAIKFKLIKPAKVSLLSQGENWVLVNLKQWILIQPGVIEFLPLNAQNATENKVENSDTQHQQSREQTIIDPPSNEPPLSWVSYYNKSPESFSKYVSQVAIEVSETEDSIDQRRLGTNSSIVLEKTRSGRANFWVLFDQNELYLVPKIGVRFNNYNIAMVKPLFKVLGEPQGDYKFTLLKPAKVMQTKEQNWQLLKPGVLQFEDK